MKKVFSIVTIFLFSFVGCKDNPTQPTTTSSSLVTLGLLAYYPFNGNALDASGNNNDGVVAGATLTNDRFGFSNTAYHFAGGSCIIIPELFSDTIPAFTFAAWVMKDTTDNNAHEIIFQGINQGQASMGISSGNAGFSVCLGNNPTNWNAANIQDTLKAKTYYFLVGRYTKGQKVEFLLNGSLVASLAIPDLPLYTNLNNKNVYSEIGTVSNQSNYYWVGVLDDIRIYNRALSDNEVLSLYHEGGWTGN
jgi:hypothetical protein